MFSLEFSRASNWGPFLKEREREREVYSACLLFVCLPGHSGLDLVMGGWSAQWSALGSLECSW